MTSLQVIAAAGRARETVVITAYEKDGSSETREVEPYSVSAKTAGEARLFAWCLKKNGMRSWHVSNITAARATGTPFVSRFRVEF